MNRFFTSSRWKPSFFRRQVHSCVNALRFGLIHVRARSFKMPQKIRVAGKQVQLRYPSDHGALADFFVCCIRNEYGLGQQLPDVTTVLDIGANVGFFSIAARSRYPRATIHAYEPNPRVVPFLQSNAALLGVHIYAEAVGADSGHVSMIDSGDSNLARVVSNNKGAIPQVSLATAVERLGGTVDLLKLDCEGAEWDLFRYAKPWRQIRHIRMEYHLISGRAVQDVERALRDLGFETTNWQCNKGFGTVWATRSKPAH